MRRWATSSTTSCWKSRKRTWRRTASPTGSRSKARSSPCPPIPRSASVASTSSSRRLLPKKNQRRKIQPWIKNRNAWPRRPRRKPTPSCARKAQQEAVTRERERVSSLTKAGEEYQDLGGVAIAKKCVLEGKSLEDFKAQMLEKMRGKEKPLAADPAKPLPAYGEGARVHFQYGKLKAFRDLPIQGGGSMKAEEAAYRAGMWLAAQVYRKDWAIKRCKELGIGFAYRDQVSGEVRVMNENVLSQGAALVPIELEAAIIQLRDTYGVARRLAKVRPMSSDTLMIPRRKGGITAYFFQDDDGVGITSSDKAWDNVGLSTKKVGALGKLSRDLIEDAVISVVDDMAQEQAYAFAKLEDQCLIIGDGTSTYGGIQGFQTKFDNNAYKSRIAAASGHHVFTTVDNADLTATMAGVSQYALVPGAVWLCSAAAKASIFGRLKAIAGGNRVDTLGMMPDDEYLGYPIVTSEACKSDPAADNTNKTILFFGRFDLAASFGSRRGIEVQVLQERYAELGLIGIIATERFDIVVHDLGDTSSVKGAVAGLYGTA
jgi:HK97 family phage major capsid protein